MEKFEKNKNEELRSENNGEQYALDDARRVKILSPSALVLKRFFRNRLALIGLIILLAMFAFSFLGALITPYNQAEVFMGYSSFPQDYCDAIYNKELRYTVVEGMNFSSAARSRFIFAQTKGEELFDADGITYHLVEEGENFYRIIQNTPIIEVTTIKGISAYNSLDDTPIDDGLKTAYAEAMQKEEFTFNFDGVEYTISGKGRITQICTQNNIALASLLIFDAVSADYVQTVNSFDFRLNAQKAINETATEFMADEKAYKVVYENDDELILDSNSQHIAMASDMIVNPTDRNMFLTIEYKDALSDAIANKKDRFTFKDQEGNDVLYTINRVADTYTIKTEKQTYLIRTYEKPSSEHWLGLDGNGMDVVTRLMYGGRISLMVGFAVVIIEIILGVIIGGISGFFGGWVDTLIMRFVDLFNSIPFWPIVIILGALMETLEVPPNARIFILMFILGVLSWPGIARVVRGQILSLREQDFMVAAEASGIRPSRRIFKHLVPNVMPLLIVQATMGLGGIIITEATLSFLGLGVKYPLASWGSIINAATDIFVMKEYWFVWIPAGVLILITVLGFNFVGDGLRDAFDPKMKR